MINPAINEWTLCRMYHTHTLYLFNMLLITCLHSVLFPVFFLPQTRRIGSDEKCEEGEEEEGGGRREEEGEWGRGNEGGRRRGNEGGGMREGEWGRGEEGQGRRENSHSKKQLLISGCGLTGCSHYVQYNLSESAWNYKRLRKAAHLMWQEH